MQNDKSKFKNKGFTLLELLVAISIFAVLVVLVVGSFGFAVSYQRRIRINREVSQASRHILDTITREVISSYNGPINRGANSTIKDQNGDTVYNFAILNTRGSPRSTSQGEVLVVRDADDMCRRFRLKKRGGIGRLAMDVKSEKGCLGSWDTHAYLTDENIDVQDLVFSGVHNTKSSPIMPYVDISFKVRNSHKFFADEIQIVMNPRTEVSIRNDGRENIFD